MCWNKFSSKVMLHNSLATAEPPVSVDQSMSDRLKSPAIIKGICWVMRRKNMHEYVDIVIAICHYVFHQ